MNIGTCTVLNFCNYFWFWYLLGTEHANQYTYSSEFANTTEGIKGLNYYRDFFSLYLPTWIQTLFYMPCRSNLIKIKFKSFILTTGTQIKVNMLFQPDNYRCCKAYT